MMYWHNNYSFLLAIAIAMYVVASYNAESNLTVNLTADKRTGDKNSKPGFEGWPWLGKDFSGRRKLNTHSSTNIPMLLKSVI